MPVVHCKKEKFDVLIDRRTKWGNPFIIGKDGEREDVIRKYKEWILNQPDLMASLNELKGKTLGCWCAPLACHGDVLSELANVKKEFVLFNPDNIHVFGNVRCDACHYEPQKCVCGGLIHYEVDGDYDEDTAHIAKCDICGYNYQVKI